MRRSLFFDDGGDGVANPGDLISYSFVVTNTGNVPLTNVSVSDPLSGLSAISCPSGNPIPSLGVGGSETCTATYAITQADINAGSVLNTATADSVETDPVEDSESVGLEYNPALEPIVG